MSKLKESGYKTLVFIEEIGLIVIAFSTVIAMGFEVKSMINAMTVTLSDLLLLFIYLEVFAMAGIYLKSGKLPVRMPLYISIVAIARYMILDMKNLDTLRILGLAGAVLILAIAILSIRYGHIKFPYDSEEDS
ncbi:phosphate-starvation-inducible protein PsiE [Psychromonas antarctica]|uniref:phosphate-starvation-inducible protein PsiE n=1 Tax=Psychromonas antarctica TaxID=67573 RepID=UPI001EE7E544|nr:phosphate-starvation-inducible PsiE family protein [Psychromonas antarctica]MCG6201640.1 phosphate-starvation-inducible PsiE family protein [Psychromonas antarctica]